MGRGPVKCAQLKVGLRHDGMGLFFSLRGPLCAGEAFIPSRPGGPSAAQCYMARRDVGPRFVPRYRSLLHPTYLRWLLKQKGCGQMQRGSRNLNGVQKVYTENYVYAGGALKLRVCLRYRFLARSTANDRQRLSSTRVCVLVCASMRRDDGQTRPLELCASPP